jgi:hypothetical protein
MSNLVIFLVFQLIALALLLRQDVISHFSEKRTAARSDQ